jgi:predicted LPLAT superfamily acyltransferase
MHWSQISEAGNALGIKILLWIARTLGRAPFRVALFFVVLWFFPMRQVARLASRDYLRHLYRFSQGQSPKPTNGNAFKHFFTFSETILDKLLAVHAPKDNAFYEGGGAEYVRELLAQNKGAIFVTAHYGNLDMCRELFQTQRKVSITFFGYTGNATAFNEMLHDLGHEIHMLDASQIGIETALILTQRLEEGGFIVIAGDRVPLTGTARTMTVPFLGAPAVFPVSPYWLAATLGCPIFSAFGRREGDAFRMSVTRLAERIVLPRDRKAREAAIAPYLKNYVTQLEQQCVEAPLQWQNFYPFWKNKSSDAAFVSVSVSEQHP